MTPFQRYLLFQVPGWMVVSAVSAVLHQWAGVSTAVAVAFVGVVVLLDIVLYPFFRHSYQPARHAGVEALIGDTAVVVSHRHVKLRGELWRFISDAQPPLEPGERGRIVGVDGLTLVVARGPALE